MARKSFIEKMEEAAGISTPEPKYEMPYKKGEYLKSGESARPWTGPTPWKKLQKKSTEGSAPFTDAEIGRGYRKV